MQKILRNVQVSAQTLLRLDIKKDENLIKTRLIFHTKYVYKMPFPWLISMR